MVIEVTMYAAYYFEENKSWSNTPVFMYKFADSPYFVILDSGFCFIKCKCFILGPKWTLFVLNI